MALNPVSYPVISLPLVSLSLPLFSLPKNLLPFHSGSSRRISWSEVSSFSDKTHLDPNGFPGVKGISLHPFSDPRERCTGFPNTPSRHPERKIALHDRMDSREDEHEGKRKKKKWGGSDSPQKWKNKYHSFLLPRTATRGSLLRFFSEIKGGLLLLLLLLLLLPPDDPIPTTPSYTPLRGHLREGRRGGGSQL